MSSLKKDTAKGFAWATLEKVQSYVIQFLIGIVIARILSPDDFGVVGMLAIFMSISTTLLGSGFTSALIRKQDRTDVDYCTAFYFNIVIGAILYGVLFFAAPWISKFYSTPILIPVTRVYCISVFINSLTIVQTAKLNIDLNFKIQSLISLITTILTGIIGIYLAYKNFGVWALVFQSLGSSIVRCILIWWLAKWRPRLTFSMESFKDLFGFGSKLLVSSIINTIYTNVYTLIIGKVFSPAAVGFFNRANQFAVLPSQITTEIITKVAYPVLSRLQKERDKLLRAYSMILTIPLTLLFPMLVGLAILAEPLVLVLLGEKWLPCVPYLQVLCLGYVFSPLTHINLNLLYVEGRSDLVLKLELIKKPIAFAILIASIPLGITWMIIGKACYEFIAFVFNCYYTGKILNYGFFKQIKQILPIALRSSLMGIIVYLSTMLVDVNVFKLLVGIIIGIISYLFLCIIMHDKTYLFLVREFKKRKVNN